MTQLTFLGTGTSQGVPIIACQCPVCKSADMRDKRYRSAAFVQMPARISVPKCLQPISVIWTPYSLRIITRTIREAWTTCVPLIT